MVKSSSGNTGSSVVPRARPTDWCLTRMRTPMMASGKLPRDRPDIRAQLTGSFTHIDQRFTRERRVVSITEKGSAIFPLPTDCGPHVELMTHIPIAPVTRHGISNPDARTTTPQRSGRDPRRAIRGLQGAAQRNCRGCAGETTGRCPISPARRSAQSTGTVGRRGADAGGPAGPV